MKSGSGTGLGNNSHWIAITQLTVIFHFGLTSSMYTSGRAQITVYASPATANFLSTPNAPVPEDITFRAEL